MYSKVDNLFWKDVKNRTLNDCEKLLLLYLLTCPHRNVLGFYVMPLLYVAADLKWDIETVTERFGKLLEKGYINYDFETEIVFIKNFLKYNSFENPNQIIGAIKSLELITLNKLAEVLLQSLKSQKNTKCKGKKYGFETSYMTLIQTLTQRVAETVPPTVTESVTESTKSKPNYMVL